MSVMILVFVYAILSIFYDKKKMIDKIITVVVLLLTVNAIYIHFNTDKHIIKTTKLINVNNIVSKDFDIELTTGKTTAVEVISTPSKFGKFIGVMSRTDYKLYINPEDVNRDDN